MFSFAFRPLYRRVKSLRHPSDRRLGAPQVRAGRRGEEYILYPIGIRTLIPRSSRPQPITIPTELFRLPQYTKKKKIIMNMCEQET
jgi:virulence-associated protein VagC